MHPVEVVMLVRALLKAASALAALCGRRGRQNMQNMGAERSEGGRLERGVCREVTMKWLVDAAARVVEGWEGLARQGADARASAARYDNDYDADGGLHRGKLFACSQILAALTCSADLCGSPPSPSAPRAFEAVAEDAASAAADEGGHLERVRVKEGEVQGLLRAALERLPLGDRLTVAPLATLACRAGSPPANAGDVLRCCCMRGVAHCPVVSDTLAPRQRVRVVLVVREGQAELC